ncbi:MAG: hypothetical protein NTV54_08170 [Ignavibacteriales bacterium]|nr:hypothetical protein [Ignavibacteriales bacterium]
MENRIEKHLDEYLSSYMDGALSELDKRRVEEYLEEHPEAQAILVQMKQQSTLLRSKPPLVPNDWFWTNLSLRMDRERAVRREVLPFSRRYIPHAVAATIAVLALMSVVLYRQRDNLQQYVAAKRAAVEHVYKEGILKGSIFPFFTKVDKNEALQFAVYGTLPMDEKTGTSLRVDERSGAGYRIEVAKSKVPRARSITVAQLCKAVGATMQQEATVDSLLAVACEKIQSSVLVGDNNAIAIHAGLPTLTRALMSNIASTLGEPQRVRFRQFLDQCNAPYTIMAAGAPPAHVSSDRLLTEMGRIPPTDRFFVIDPDSAMVSDVHINIDSLRSMMFAASLQMEKARERVHSAIREFAVRNRQRAPRPYSVTEDEDRISIQVSAAEPVMPDESFFFRLVPRISGAGEGGRLPFVTPDAGMSRSQIVSQRRAGDQQSSAPARIAVPANRGPVSLDSLLNDVRKSLPQRESRKKVPEDAIEL